MKVLILVLALAVVGLVAAYGWHHHKQWVASHPPTIDARNPTPEQRAAAEKVLLPMARAQQAQDREQRQASGRN